MSHGHATKTLQAIDEEIAQLLSKAEQADAVPLQDGLSIPDEMTRRQERKARLLQAKAEMEARAYARFQAEQADYEAKQTKREEDRTAGKPPKGRPPKAPDPKPAPDDQVNFTDRDSGIMPTKDGFQQAYNAQAGVEVASRLIVGARVAQATNDKRQLAPTLAEVRRHLSPANVLVDSGFASETAIRAVEAETPGLTVLAAVQREAHGRTVAQLEKRDDPPAPGPGATFTEHLRHRRRPGALQTAPANRRTRLRDHQRSAGV